MDNECTTAPRPPAGSPPRSGRTPYKWEEENEEECLGKERTPSTTRRGRRGKSHSNGPLLTSTAIERKAKNLLSAPRAEEHVVNQEKQSHFEREKLKEVSSQAPSPSTSPLNGSEAAEPQITYQPKTPKEDDHKKRRPRRRSRLSHERVQEQIRSKTVEVENIHPNQSMELVSSPSSTVQEEKRKSMLERRRAQAAESKRQLDEFINSGSGGNRKSREKAKRKERQSRTNGELQKKSTNKSANSSRKSPVLEK